MLKLCSFKIQNGNWKTGSVRPRDAVMAYPGILFPRLLWKGNASCFWVMKSRKRLMAMYMHSLWFLKFDQKNTLMRNYHVQVDFYPCILGGSTLVEFSKAKTISGQFLSLREEPVCICQLPGFTLLSFRPETGSFQTPDGEDLEVMISGSTPCSFRNFKICPAGNAHLVTSKEKQGMHTLWMLKNYLDSSFWLCDTKILKRAERKCILFSVRQWM